MKKLLLIVLLSLFHFSVIWAQNQHLGTWEGTDGGDTGSFTFDSLGYAYMTMQGITMGGPDYKDEGRIASLAYKIDYTTKPVSIDFILTDKTHNSVSRMLAIIEFLSSTQMKIRLDFSGQSRPKDFLPEGNSDTMILTKK
jgi:hypothetical protein